MWSEYKIFYKLHVYESVDEWNLSWFISHKSTESRTQKQKAYAEARTKYNAVEDLAYFKIQKAVALTL